MQSYHKLLKHILVHGEERDDRTGVGTLGVFGYQMRMDLAQGFPLLTTKKVWFRGVVEELLWFLRGETNIRSLQAAGVHIWDEWADEKGELGPVYGCQWRHWDYQEGLDADGNVDEVDQIANLVRDLRANPNSRRHVVSAWNPRDVPNMALPPCHTLWQCYVGGGRRLSLHLYARSIDSFLGLPFNIASYALLTHMLAQVTGNLPGELVISFGDLHIYKNHLEQVRTQLGRVPRLLPRLWVNPEVTDIFGFTGADFKLEGYDPYEALPAPVAV